jgi:hypothetical protein
MLEASLLTLNACLELFVGYEILVGRLLLLCEPGRRLDAALSIAFCVPLKRDDTCASGWPPLCRKRGEARELWSI